MSEINHETFDLASVLSGVGFPEEEVDVVFDESVNYEVYKAERSLRLSEIKGNEEELKEISERLDELKRTVKDKTFKVTVRGIPESTRRACDKKARDKFPVSYSFLGQPEPDPERDDYFNALIWSSSIVKVTDPQGRVSIPNEENILQMRTAVGRSVVATISDAIQELVTGVKSGFESSVQDVDFLSEASQED